MARNPTFVMDYLTELEDVAEDILSDKQIITGLDYKRNKSREALRHVTNEIKDPDSRGKSWFCFGKMFVQMPNEKAKFILEKEKKELDDEMEQRRNNMKIKVHKLREMEGKPELTGFNLTPLSKQEMSAINQVLQGSST